MAVLRAPELPSAEQLEELQLLLSGYAVSQAIYVVARLGIADLLADGPMDHQALARTTATHAQTLCRVLRFLAAVGLFEEVRPGWFGLTPFGAGLRRDVPGSRHPWALLLDDGRWAAWGELLHTVRTGEPAFRHVHGMGRFEYLRQHPEYASIFQEAMAGEVEEAAIALSAAYDLSTFERVVDVGGGQGALLARVLQRCATARGVLFDRPETVAAAPALLAAAGVADRCEIVGGDFFAAVPVEGDAYILSQVVHDWPDPDAVRILRNCRVAMRDAGRLLVVERALGPDPKTAFRVLHTDMSMLVHLGGLERTAAEYHALFAEAGFQLANVVPLGDRSRFSVFEGVPIGLGAIQASDDR